MSTSKLPDTPHGGTPMGIPAEGVHAEDLQANRPETDGERELSVKRRLRKDEGFQTSEHKEQLEAQLSEALEKYEETEARLDAEAEKGAQGATGASGRFAQLKDQLRSLETEVDMLRRAIRQEEKRLDAAYADKLERAKAKLQEQHQDRVTQATEAVQAVEDAVEGFAALVEEAQARLMAIQNQTQSPKVGHMVHNSREKLEGILQHRLGVGRPDAVDQHTLARPLTYVVPDAASVLHHAEVPDHLTDLPPVPDAE